MIRAPRKRKSRFLTKPFIGLVIVVLLLLAGGAAVLYHRHKSAENAAKQAAVVPRPVSDKGTGTTTTTPSQNSSTSNKTGQNSTSSSAPQSNPSSQTLQKPAGTFVSNHKPGQNGSPEQESSVCMTTPGATCSISFNQGTTTKTLPVQTADSTGSVYWQSWTPASVGLSTGKWTVKATATLGQQTATTQDPNTLEVK